MLQKLAFRSLQRLSPEVARALAIRILPFSTKFLPPIKQNEVLSTSILGLNFRNPIAFSAGFDKNCDVIDELYTLGFGFVEVGTITPRAQDGNKEKNFIRLPDDYALINNFGLNNVGFDVAYEKMKKRKISDGILGINLGANKKTINIVNDYVLGLNKFYSIASYFTLNISCPNVNDYYNFHNKEKLRPLLETIMEERDKLQMNENKFVPIFLKISPDIDDKQLNSVCQEVLKNKVDGLVISNTTKSREGLKDVRYKSKEGGLSGKPLFEVSTRMIAKARNIVGSELAIIGVGGIDSGETAWAKVTAGANLLQLYTGLAIHGFGLVNEIMDHLAKNVQRNNYDNLQQAVGRNLKDWLE